MKSIVPALIVGIVLAALVFAARCTQQRMHDYETSQADAGGASTASELKEQEAMAEAFPDTLLTTAGIRYKILRPGQGAKPIAGSEVTVDYAGRLLDGTVFDSSYSRGEPIVFRVMAGQVIRGWDLSLMDMRVGEKRLVVLPYRLAYGDRGRPPTIPARATLVFEIDLQAAR